MREIFLRGMLSYVCSLYSYLLKDGDKWNGMEQYDNISFKNKII